MRTGFKSILLEIEIGTLEVKASGLTTTPPFANSDSVWLSMSGRQFRKALSKEEKNALQESIPK